MKKVVFTIPATYLNHAYSAHVLGDFNQWTPSLDSEMTAQADGSLSVTLNLEAGKIYQYRFLLNDGTWLNDPAAKSYQEDKNFFTHNSIIQVEEDTEPALAVAEKATVEPKVAPKKAATKKTTAKKELAKDAFEKIKGINVATRNVLHKNGILSFSKLSKTSKATLQKILTAAGEKYAGLNFDTWSKQAKALAAEKAASLKK